MEFRESKLEWTVVVIAGLLLMAVLWLFKMMERPSQIETANVVYEMPRPMKSEMASEFTLGDREIIRELVKKEPKIIKANELKDKPKPPTPKKTAKKKDDKDKKKSDVDVNVVDADQEKTKRTEEEPVSPPAVADMSIPAPEEQAAPEANHKQTKSLAEWRSLLMSKPSRENMSGFIKAWRDQEIQASGFYSVTQEMILTKKPETQTTALYGLQQVPHVQSFAMLARHHSQLTPENQTLAKQIMMSYGSPQRLPILAQALQMKDVAIVTFAAEAVTLGLQRAKTGQSVQDPRQVRGSVEATPQSVEHYGRFVSTFQQWQQSGDTTLVNLANSFLTHWQT
jgi:hypothetical protein